MNDMKKKIIFLVILKTISTMVALVFGLGLIARFNPPSMGIALIAAGIAGYVCCIHRRIPTRKGILFVGILLTTWIIVFEYVPPGDLSPETMISGVRFKHIVGEYYSGDGLGFIERLNVNPDGRFTYQHYGCLGIYRREKGWVEEKDGYLVLHPRFWERRKNLKKLLPVKWGERLYLVSEGRMIEFCSRINLRQEPRTTPYGPHYLRAMDVKTYEDYKKTPAGRPALPKQWLEYLLDTPVKGKIVSIMDQNAAVINSGYKAGLREGMHLYAEDHDTIIGQMVIIKNVFDNRSEIVCMFSDRPLAVGQSVSTELKQYGGTLPKIKM